MPLNSSQRSAVQQFSAVTQSNEKAATKALKSTSWNVQQAIDAYYRNSGITPPTVISPQITALNKFFDEYRDSPQDSPDNIGIQGVMKYMEDLGVKLDEPVVLTISHLVDAQTMGEFARDGFVKGWKSYSAETLSKQKNTVNSLRSSLPRDDILFKQVYRHTFLIARTPGQKSVALETAVEYWKLLFTPPGGLGWSTSTTPWLDYWLEFVTNTWKRAINKDMWNMLLEFVNKTRQDEAFGWWDEGGAWPSVLDSFVGFVKEKRDAQGKMEVE